MSLSGTFVHASSNNLDAWLKAAGASDAVISKAMAAKPTLVITDTGSGLTINSKSADKEFTNTITYGQESPMEIAGIEYTMNVSKTASGYAGTISGKGKTGSTTCELSGSTLTRSYTLGDVAASHTYTKQ
ncbi:Calycin [Trinorchestia longiramus]|nr:Calycin [Trinorchestia longiramus]